MSFDVYFQRFEDGDSAPADALAVRAVLEPHVDEAEDGGVVRLAVGDGHADIHGFDTLESGFMANHISGVDAWGVLVVAAQASDPTIIPVGCPACVVEAGSAAHLPEPLRAEVRLVTSGSELLEVIENS